MQLNELMDLYAKLVDRVLALEHTNTSQATEIATLKESVKKLEKKRRSKTYKPRRLYKVGLSRRIESSDDAICAADPITIAGEVVTTASVKIPEELTLAQTLIEIKKLEKKSIEFGKEKEVKNIRVQEIKEGKEVVAEKEVAKKEVSVVDPVTTAGEVVTIVNVEVTTASAPTTTTDELTLAQILIKIKAAKPKAVTSAATTTTTTRPKARGVVVQELSEFKTTSSPLQASQLPQAKDKGNAKMVEPEKPLKKKDQIAMDEEVA
ncbi:hypothetical protein Tco_1053300 [Tanacetum coccineum]